MLGWYLRMALLVTGLVFLALPFLYLFLSTSFRIDMNSYVLFSSAVISTLWFMGKRKVKSGCSTLEELREKATKFGDEKIELFKFPVRDGNIISAFKIGHGKKVILCGNGLGCSAIFAIPVMRYFEQQENGDLNLLDECTIVSWDYRGLFTSSPGTENMLSPFFSVRDSAEDARELLDFMGVKTAHAYIGYSTGVQVGLEFASMYPDRVEKLVLINGAHGQLLHSLLQPVFRIPCLGDLFHRIIIGLRSYDEYWFVAKRVVLAMATFSATFVIRPFCAIIQRDYELFAFNYFLEFFEHGKTHSSNYLRYPHALDAHSSYHILHEISHPTLLITGMLDVLTPAYHSYEMCSRMPNAELQCFLMGTHFVLLEYPNEIGKRIYEFLKPPEYTKVEKGRSYVKPRIRRSRSKSRRRKSK